MAEPAGKPGAGLKGLDIIVGMGAPPKLGSREKTPRPMTSKTYRGSPAPAIEGGDPEAEENMFDKDEAPPDEMLVGAAHDIMTAFHSRDPEGVAAALKAFVTMI